MKVPLKQAQDLVGFATYFIDMFSPVEVACNVDPEILDGILVFEFCTFVKGL